MHGSKILLACLAFVVSLRSAPAEVAGDWPQFLGPQRRGVSEEAVKLVEKFPETGPKVLWKQALGAGFAGPVVSGETVFVFHRLGSEAHLLALAATTGKLQWDFAYATDYRDSFGFDAGPRACPTVAGDAVFLYGAEGKIHAVERATGKLRWMRDAVAEFGSEQGFFGRAGAPLVLGDRVIVHPGGEDAAVVALDVLTGQTLWKAGKQAAGYASPILWQSERGPCIVSLLREGLLGLAPQDGSVMFETHYRSSMEASVNAATPVVIDDTQFFTTACYNTGAALWKLSATGLEPVWKAVGKLEGHYATPIFVNDVLYGMHGRQDTGGGMELRCIEVATGNLKWKSTKLPASEILSADGKLLIVTEDGELILATQSPEKWSVLDRGQILSAGHRSPPALAQGVLYARDKQKLVAVKLTP